MSIAENAIPSYGSKGYGEAGASYRKKALKGFIAHSGSPQEDIDYNNYTLRQRARMLYMAAPIATSAIRTNRTNVVGCGLKLKSRINREYLGLTQEAADAWEKQTEAEFDLWASQKQACDATGINDFYAIQQLTLVSWLLSGDAFVLFKQYEPTPLCPYSLRLHVIEADRISTPGTYANGSLFQTDGKVGNNRIYDGVEVNEYGAIDAYHIRNNYPLSAIDISKETEWQRVAAYGENTGLPNILQIMDSERPDQYRGVTYLAQVIEPLLQMRRYTESELTAALVQSFFTVFIKTEGDPGEGMPFNTTGEQISHDPNDYELGAGQINMLKPGESADFANPTRPTSGFDAFMRSMCEQVGAALEIPADLLLKAFDASYSASRAALLEAWKAFKMRREWFTSDFCRPVYAVWLSEAVARGRIQSPGFFSDPMVRNAWLGSEWIGPSQGQLDPVKEINAEILAIKEGITTREQAATRINGSSWDSNMDQIARENKRLTEAGCVPADANSQIDLQTTQEGDENAKDSSEKQDN